MIENLYVADSNKQWSGTASQCFTCTNPKCNRNLFKQNKVKGKEVRHDNPGVVLNSFYCKNRME